MNEEPQVSITKAIWIKGSWPGTCIQHTQLHFCFHVEKKKKDKKKPLRQDANLTPVYHSNPAFCSVQTASQNRTINMHLNIG